MFDSPIEPLMRRRLDAFPRRAIAPGGNVAAAVAVVLLRNRVRVPCFVLTRRARHLRRHAGQWALPGGRRDEGETARQAARRELEEEVGLTGAEVAGELDDYVTQSGYVITPVVLLAAPIARLRPNPSEVAGAHRIPLALLDDPRHRLIEEVDGRSTLRLRILGGSSTRRPLPSCTSSPRSCCMAARPGWITSFSPSSHGVEGTHLRQRLLNFG